MYNDCNGIKAAATRIGAFAGVQASNVTISYDTGPGSTPLPYCDSTTPQLSSDLVILRGRVVVNVIANYNPLVPLVPIPSMTLVSQSSHTLIVGAEVVPASNGWSVGETCDNTPYKIFVTDPKGKKITNSDFRVKVELTNTSTESRHIENLLLVWDPGSALNSAPRLFTITYPDESGDHAIPATTSNPLFDGTAPTYVDWTFPPATSLTFYLDYSTILTNNVVVRLTLDNGCSFGK
jgi:hypothetical protein